MDLDLEVARIKDRLAKAEREIEQLKRKKAAKPKSQAAIKAEILALKGQPAPTNDCPKCEGSGHVLIDGIATECECLPEFRERVRLWGLANNIRYKEYVRKEPKKKSI
jgi:hypothetical protein